MNALVTGASRGIGRAIAFQLAARGVRVVVHYHRNRIAADETLRALSGKGHVLASADLTVEADAHRLWREASATCGSIDLLINNAGHYEKHPPLETSPEAWREVWQRTLSANLTGPATLAHLAAQAMSGTGRGRIVAISSRGAFRGEPSAPAYGASKAGLNALHQSLAAALAPHGVQVMVVAPGWVDTDMASPWVRGPQAAVLRDQHPLGRVATAEEVARVAVFCALDAPATMTGAVVDVNGASYLRT
ncbi:MAG TPA: SDR family oxidoreductase [Opitutaceae bacterium]